MDRDGRHPLRRVRGRLDRGVLLPQAIPAQARAELRDEAADGAVGDGTYRAVWRRLWGCDGWREGGDDDDECLAAECEEGEEEVGCYGEDLGGLLQGGGGCTKLVDREGGVVTSHNGRVMG